MSQPIEILNMAFGPALTAVLNSLWQAALVALTAWTALRFGPRINAATRYVVWWGVLAVILMLPLAPSFLRPWQRPGATAVSVSPTVAGSLASLPSNAKPAPAPLDYEPAAKVQLHEGSWIFSIFAAWVAVFLFSMAELGWSYRYLRGIKRRSEAAGRDHRLKFDQWVMACHIRRPVRLLVCSEIATPIAVGFMHPAVILPQGLLSDVTGPDLDHMLLHELAHIARWDDWTNLAGRIAASAVTLHPLARWVLRRIERERELACDDWVVALTGSARPYATSLARLFDLCWTRRRELLATGIAGRGSQLGERIEMLLRRGRQFDRKASLVRVTLSIMVLLAFLLAGAQAPRWIAFAQAQELPAPPAPVVDQAEVQAPPLPPAPPAPPVPATLAQAAQRPRPAPAPVPAAPVPPPPPPSSSHSLLKALIDAGYGGLAVDEIIDLKNNGVTAEFIRGINQAGWGKLTPKQLVELRIHGVPPDYAGKMRAAGLRDLKLHEVIDLRNNGVRPEDLQDIHSLGFGPYTTKESIQFWVNGVRPDLFRALKDAGFTHLEANEIIEARINGVSAGNLREAKAYGSNLTLKQIIRLKQAGVI